MVGNSYCLREKKKTANKDEKVRIVDTKRGKRKILSSICASCGAKKSEFVSMGGSGINLGKVKPKASRTPAVHVTASVSHPVPAPAKTGSGKKKTKRRKKK